MASDLSRLIFDRKKHYSGVRLQQGRVLLDSDWNEQLDLQLYRTHTQTKDVIGKCGVPKKSDAFLINLNADHSTFDIKAGRIYVDGLLCQLDDTLDFFNQPYYPNPDPDQQFFAEIDGDPSTELLAGTYIVYIDAWQRAINYLDDPLIQEVALGEADTSTRLQTVWQVKLLAVEEPLVCSDNPTVWKNLIANPTGKLNVQTSPLENASDPCVLPPSAGYQRLENQLYRIEIQKGGDQDTATFKWSRDNASVETIITDIQGDTLHVESIGRDHVLGFANGQWVEIVSESTSLNQQANPLVKIQSVDPSTRTITLDSPSFPLVFEENLKLRRWDQNTNADQEGIAITNGWMAIEGGIKVEFTAGTYKAGDYWLIPARTATSDVEWPFDSPQTPMGVRHAYCKLGIIQPNGTNWEVLDCRPKFPTLTEICAEDICYDNSNCDLSSANNVQEALDELCRKPSANSCTYILSPDDNWEKILTEIPKGTDAQICFQVGTYVTSDLVLLHNKGHLKITGSGLGTKIIHKSKKAALIFDSCKSVCIRDIAIETSATRRILDDPAVNGSLSFIDCPKVVVDQVHLKCGTASEHIVNCLTIRNNPKSIPLSFATIQNCKFNIGHAQEGILLVNVSEALVTNNYLDTYEKDDRFNLGFLLKNPAYRKNLEKWLVGNISVKPKRPILDDGTATTFPSVTGIKRFNTQLNFDRFTLDFKTDKTLEHAWHAIFKDNPPERITQAKDVEKYITTMAKNILFDANFRNKYSAVSNLYAGIRSRAEGSSIASKSITIGGQIAHNVRILNNTIKNTLQGIHIGLSHRNEPAEPYFTKHLTIEGNDITVVLPFFISKIERYGIYVGNCTSLVIENNTIQLIRLANPGALNDVIVEGIHVWGAIGARVMISKNHLHNISNNDNDSFDIGILLQPTSAPEQKTLQWAIIWNVVASRRTFESDSIKAPQNTIIRDNATS